MEPYNDRVTRCGDGKYRWVYEYPMLKNPTILLTTLKLFLLCGLAPVGIVVLSSLSREGIGALVSGLQVYGILVLIALPLTLISYGILAMNYGWTYIVLFEMDETGITHLQQPRQFQKAQGLAWLSELAGGGDPAAAGRGLAIAAHNSSTTRFSQVRRMKRLPRWDTIKLHGRLHRNQVYVPQPDGDFVWNYIAAHCPQAKKSVEFGAFAKRNT